MDERGRSFQLNWTVLGRQWTVICVKVDNDCPTISGEKVEGPKSINLDGTEVMVGPLLYLWTVPFDQRTTHFRLGPWDRGPVGGP